MKDVFLELDQLLWAGYSPAELQVSGSTFFAHRCVLALGSSYFKALYTTELADSRSLEQVSVAAFEACLSWLYEGSCTIQQDGLVSLLEAADLLGVLPLRDAAVTAIVERLSPQSCIGAWDLAIRYSLPILADAARDACLASFTESATCCCAASTSSMRCRGHNGREAAAEAGEGGVRW